MLLPGYSKHTTSKVNVEVWAELGKSIQMYKHLWNCFNKSLKCTDAKLFPRENRLKIYLIALLGDLSNFVLQMCKVTAFIKASTVHLLGLFLERLVYKHKSTSLRQLLISII